MANPSEVEAQVRFALSQLPAHNAQHTFEHICRHLTQQFICSNVLPATGPVSAGGDQGRDFETFRTYLCEELGPHGAFLGLVSEGTIAFICTTQADGLSTKIRHDIEKVCASGHPVHEIRAFTLGTVPVGSRHQLETEAQESYQVRLELHDAESVANLLALPDGFWIAERFLSIPASIRPEVQDTNGHLAAEYIERRDRWRDRNSPNPTLGDFVDLKAGLREAIYHKEARGNLPFWLGLVRQLLANPDCPAHIQQRARYELVVCTFLGTRDLRPVEDVVRVYLDTSLDESEPARLQDASALLMYVNTAVRWGCTSLTPDELRGWNESLTTRARTLAAQEMPHRRASLLFAIGHLGLHPALWEIDFQVSSDEANLPHHLSQSVELSTLGSVSLPDDLVLADVSQTLSAWTELVENLDETPIFPIQTMADILQLLVPLWSNHAEWRRLLDLVDEAVSERSGKHVLGSRARDRATKLLEAGRCLDALEELHQTKIEWWSGETVRGSLLAMITISRLYFDLRLPQASKAYALAVAYIAALRNDDALADLVPTGLLMAARADFTAGAWWNAMELYELGLDAQYEYVEDGLESERHTMVEDALLHLAYVKACAEFVDPDLSVLINETVTRIGVQEVIEGAVDSLNVVDQDFWESFVDKGLLDRPFADIGEERHIRFSALGTDWTLIAANDTVSVREAERFAAAAQVMLAALAREDLCLIQTRITVHVESMGPVRTPALEQTGSIPSSDGREWTVRLASMEAGPSADEIVPELLTMLTVILREASLLPEAEFSASVKRAFERGLGHKLSPARPYDELAACFGSDPQRESQRSQFNTPWDCHNGASKEHSELRWQDGPGPTYSRERANEFLQTRYVTLAKSLRITVPMLKSSAEFRSTVEKLRKNGWLDWHILAAISNIVMNYRFPSDRFNLLSETTQREMMKAASSPEIGTAEPVPAGLFTIDAMNYNRQLAMLSLLNHWGLECQQMTPDVPAIERLMADRYGYWDEDIPHDDPFPEPNDRGLVIIEDVPPPLH